MLPMMANSKDGQNHNDKNGDTSRKFQSKEMTISKYSFSRSYDCHFFKEQVKCKDQKVKYQQKDLTCNTRNIHVKYQSSSNHYSNFINKVIVFKKYARLQGQGQKEKNVGTFGVVLSYRILM